MVFNSYIFIFFLLPFTVFGYYVINKLNIHLGKLFLILCSGGFYLPAGVSGLLILCISIVLNYILGRQISKGDRKKLFLSIGVVFNILMLFVFKYFNFFIDNIEALFKLNDVAFDIFIPLGISFYTFQQIACLIEVYEEGQTFYNFEDYVLYVLYFPKLIMGPITMPKFLIAQFNDVTKKTLIMDNLVSGIQMFAYGLFKKVFFADTFSKAVEWGFTNLDIATSTDLIIVMLSYTLQIYFDFSGYSDMAVGISRMLNVELPINFDSPYKALSIRDFWKRWHISLTQFLTRFVYVPLGGNRKGKTRTYINIIAVFLISGIWHGANWTFILWGFLHGVGNVLDRIWGQYISKLGKIIRWCITFICINVLWLLFRANTITEWGNILRQIFMFENMELSASLSRQFSLPEFWVLFYFLRIENVAYTINGFEMLIMLISAFVVCICCKNNNMRKDNTVINLILVPIIMIWGILCLGAESTFVYFNF